MEPTDFLCLISGSQWPISQKVPELACVEYAVGYQGIQAPYRVFPTYAWMHAVYGHWYGAANCDPSDFDAVIPHFFNPDEFPLQTEKEDYFMYIGRLTDRKGWRIAQDVCERKGVRLLVAGRPEPGQGFDGYGEYLGVLAPADRAAAVGGSTCHLHAHPIHRTLRVRGRRGPTLWDTRHLLRHGWCHRDREAWVQRVALPQPARLHERPSTWPSRTITALATTRTSAVEAVARYGQATVGAEYERYFAKLDRAKGEGWYAP